MPRSRPELDVLLVGHAALGEIGGLTSWARGLAAAPDQRIGAIGISGRPTELPAARIYHAMTPAAAESIRVIPALMRLVLAPAGTWSPPGNESISSVMFAEHFERMKSESLSKTESGG